MISTLANDLRHFSASENYYEHKLLGKRFRHTDGIEYLALNAKAYWLIDLVASHQSSNRCRENCTGFQLWTLRRLPKGHKYMAVAELRRDSNERWVLRQFIPYTDFPFDDLGSKFKIYVTGTFTTGLTMMLPSEF